VALVLLDLDDFKTTNDSLGHAAGDRLLAGVAERIRACLAPGETAVRLGGDEVAIVSVADGPSRAQRLAETLLGATRTPWHLEADEIRLATTIGVAHGRVGSTAESLLRDADLALYAAKSAGNGHWHPFQPTLHEQAVERPSLVAALRRAIDEQTLELHHQPLVSVRDGATVGTEARARWSQAGRSIGPETFTPWRSTAVRSGA
jgi:diguanylate cyclase (GGDEF)-like protein